MTSFPSMNSDSEIQFCWPGKFIQHPYWSPYILVRGWENGPADSDYCDEGVHYTYPLSFLTVMYTELASLVCVTRRQLRALNVLCCLEYSSRHASIPSPPLLWRSDKVMSVMLLKDVFEHLERAGFPSSLSLTYPDTLQVEEWQWTLMTISTFWLIREKLDGSEVN